MPLLLYRVILSVSLVLLIIGTTNSQISDESSKPIPQKEQIIAPIIKVLPNPSLGTFAISSDHTIETLKIYDLIGTLVQESKVNATNYRLAGNQLSHGIYVLHLSIDGKDWVRKLLVH